MTMQLFFPPSSLYQFSGGCVTTLRAERHTMTGSLYALIWRRNDGGHGPKRRSNGNVDSSGSSAT